MQAQVSGAASEQAQSIEQINRAVTKMKNVTQQTAANTEESASTSEQMTAQAAQMPDIRVNTHPLAQL